MSLNWIVPFRRAVVTQTIVYRSCLVLWQEQLENNREKIKSWYHIDDNAYSIGVRFACPNQQLLYFCGHNENLIDLFFPSIRLWKGPLRILLEEKRRNNENLSEEERSLLENEPSDIIVDRNNMTKLLIGDVIEFPFHKFLLKCGKNEYDVYEYDRTGSFFLGTSLTPKPSLSEDEVQNINNPPIHDNLIAMKFQHLLNLAIGSFYYLMTNSEQYNNNDFSHNVGSLIVNSRGMIYGGDFTSSSARTYRNSLEYKKHWIATSFGWGYRSGHDSIFCTALPAPRSIINWNELDVLTPGWACSTVTLFLSNFLFCQPGGLYGSKGIDNTMEMDSADIQNCLEKRITYRLSGNENDNTEHREYGIIETDSQGNVITNWIDDQLLSLDTMNFLKQRDINILCYHAHEKAIVKLFPPEKLKMENTLPIFGFIAAYNPFNGLDMCASSLELNPDGKLFFFEADAYDGIYHYFKFNDITYTLFGVKPFKFQEVGEDYDPYHGDNPVSQIYQNKIDSFSNLDIYNDLKQIRILDKANRGWARDDLQETNPPERLRSTVNYYRKFDEFYSTRAITFPTMNEINDIFPQLGNIINPNESTVWHLINDAKNIMNNYPPTVTSIERSGFNLYRNEILG